MQPVEFAVIAAAGLGSRLGHGLPKCMIEIGGSTLLTRLVTVLRPLVRRIHVVIGYREELVISHCANLHRDVVLVRNPEFRTTNTAQSMALGARGCSGKVVFMDADLLIAPESLKNFVAQAAAYPVLAGITPRGSEGPVGVELHLEHSASLPMITDFRPQASTPYEWANIVAGPAGLMADTKGYVFEKLAQLAPLAACELDLREVDTGGDLKRAIEFAATLDAHRGS